MLVTRSQARSQVRQYRFIFLFFVIVFLVTCSFWGTHVMGLIQLPPLPLQKEGKNIRDYKQNLTYRIRSINSRAYYLKTGSWKSEVRGEINRRAYGENKKAGRKQCLQCLIRTRVLFERIRYIGVVPALLCKNLPIFIYLFISIRYSPKPIWGLVFSLKLFFRCIRTT